MHYLNQDEKQIIRIPFDFASAVAPALNGQRSFRDFHRADIGNQLPGWPGGVPLVAHGSLQSGLLRTARTTTNLAIMATQLWNGATAPDPVGPAQREPSEPENETEDFPVLWADPGTVARNAPYQLDPARRLKAYRTFIAATDQRLLVLGTPTAKGDSGPWELLWQVPNSALGKAERMGYSRAGADVRITFTDTSWIRLAPTPPSTGLAQALTDVVNGRWGQVEPSSLTEAQAQQAEAFLASLPVKKPRPRYIRTATGSVLLEVYTSRISDSPAYTLELGPTP